MLKDYILVHLHDNSDKFSLLVFMMQKLYALVDGEIQEDRTDSAMMHEVLLPGHIYLMLLKVCVFFLLPSSFLQTSFFLLASCFLLDSVTPLCAQLSFGCLTDRKTLRAGLAPRRPKCGGT